MHTWIKLPNQRKPFFFPVLFKMHECLSKTEPTRVEGEFSVQNKIFSQCIYPVIKKALQIATLQFTINVYPSSQIKKKKLPKIFLMLSKQRILMYLPKYSHNIYLQWNYSNARLVQSKTLNFEIFLRTLTPSFIQKDSYFLSHSFSY